MGGNVQIAIGNATTGIGAQLSEGDAPTVHSVGLGNVNGVALGFQEGAPGGERHRDQGRQHLHDQRHRDRGRHGQPDAAGDEAVRDRGYLPLID